MIKSAVTISLVPEAQGGPFVFWDNLAGSCAKAEALGFDAVEIFAPSAEALDARQLKQLLTQHRLNLAALGTGAGWVLRKLRLTDPDPAVRTPPFGYPLAPTADPQRLTGVETRAADSFAVTDVDQALPSLNPGVGWWDDLPNAPVHGQVRNQLFFDAHVEAVRW